MEQTDVEDCPIPDELARGGRVLDVDLFEYGHLLIQEPSRYALHSAICLFVCAVTLCFIRMDIPVIPVRQANLGVALIFAVGGVSMCLFYVGRRITEQRVVIDRITRKIHLIRQDGAVFLDCMDVVALQLCGNEVNGFQVNLVFRLPSGDTVRRCLASHVAKAASERLARTYVEKTGFVFVDSTTCVG